MKIRAAPLGAAVATAVEVAAMAMATATAALWRSAVAAQTAEIAAMAIAMAAAGLQQHNTHAVSTCMHMCAGRLATCEGRVAGKGNAPAMRAV